MWGLVHDTLLSIVVGFMWGNGQHFTGYWLMCLGQHFLDIAAGLCWASGNTLCWILLWAMRGFGQHTLLGIIRSDVGHLHQWVLFLNDSRKVEVLLRNCRNEYPLTNRITWHCFPVSFINLYKRATIRQISYSQSCTFPPNRPEDGYMLVTIG
jgi:hypothetical protein